MELRISLSHLLCSECGKLTKIVIAVGQEPAEGSETAYLCVECAKKVGDEVEGYPE